MWYVQLPSDDQLPVLGQGTWMMGEHGSEAATEVAALRHGLDLGIGLIDTAEMYGGGGAEEIVAEAITGRRDETFLVSKVFPHNATRSGTIEACERSLRRLRTEYLDLYLLHWRGNIPLAETLEAFGELQAAGKIHHFGVSNFDTANMADLWSYEAGRGAATNQVLYNLARRGIEFDLLSWCRRRGLPVMAYSPIEQGRLLDDSVLARVAKRHSATSAQVALAWVLRHDGVCAIPKAANREHVDHNFAALDIALSPADLSELEARFPAPERATPLEIL